jgi:hypothetical protein
MGDTSFDVGQHPIHFLGREHRNERRSECQAQQAEQANDLEVGRNEKRIGGVGTGNQIGHRFLLVHRVDVCSGPPVSGV